MRSRITTAILSSLLVVAGCSSSDNSSDEMDMAGDPSNDTSQPAPGGDNGELPLSSDPGGDTSAIAGLWDASVAVEGGNDLRYVLISSDGLYTDYDYRQDAVATDGNCYLAIGPQTLTPEDAATNTYSLADDRSFAAVTEADTLSIQFAGGEPQEWQALPGISIDESDLCT